MMEILFALAIAGVLALVVLRGATRRRDGKSNSGWNADGGFSWGDGDGGGGGD
jgi:hypothetical protein